jgi:hypothetical protein
VALRLGAAREVMWRLEMMWWAMKEWWGAVQATVL